MGIWGQEIFIEKMTGSGELVSRDVEAGPRDFLMHVESFLV